MKYRAKPDPRSKRRSYTEEDAKRVLGSAGKERDAHFRWVPRIEAFTGARLNEICGADREPGLEGAIFLWDRLSQEDGKS